MKPTYFFSKADTDFKLQGSRDPMGLQVLWQHAGSQILPFLSTVSNSIIDFKIICLAHCYFDHLKHSKDQSFINAFIKFEQMTAYARFLNDPITGFNGIDTVRRTMAKGQKTVTISKANHLLTTNQKTYAIRGKYNSPFKAIDFLSKKAEMKKIFDRKIYQNSSQKWFEKWFKKCATEDRFNIHKNKAFLQPLIDLLNFNAEEITFFTKEILQHRMPHHPQNALFIYFQNNKNQLITNDLYALIQDIQDQTSHQKLKNDLENIKNTEHVLCPINRIFHYLQTKDIWKKSDLIKDKYLDQCKGGVEAIFDKKNKKTELVNNLNIILQTEDNWELVKKMVHRTTEIFKQRGKLAWMIIEGKKLLVHHRGGQFQQADFDPMRHTDNFYFLNTYLHLFNQITQWNNTLLKHN